MWFTNKDTFISGSVCRVCLEAKTDRFINLGEEALSVLQFVYPEFDSNISSNLKICSNCTANLKSTYTFKRFCANNDGILSKKASPDGEVGGSEPSSSVAPNEEIGKKCTICYKSRNSIDEIEENQDNDFLNMREHFSPDMKPSRLSRPCTMCLESLKNLFAFSNTCKNSERQVKEYCSNKGCTDYSKVNLFEIFVFHNPEKPVRSELSTVHKFKCELCSYETKCESWLYKHMVNHNPSRSKIYSCDLCPYITETKFNLDQHHTHQHNDMSHCSKCPYKSTNMEHFQVHLLTHKEPSTSENDSHWKNQEGSAVDPTDVDTTDIKEEVLDWVVSDDFPVDVTGCKLEEEKGFAECPVSSSLTVREEDSMGSFQMECKQDLQDLIETPVKDTPEIIRRSGSPVIIYLEADVVSADSSDVKRGRKKEVHEVITNDGSMDVTNRKSEEGEASGSITQKPPKRQRRRKDPSKGRIFKCRFCKFETKVKSSLVEHRREHTTFTCDKCPYSTKIYGNFKHHQGVHDKGTMYCSMCSYRSKNKVLFEHHLLIHRGSNESENDNAPKSQECTSVDLNDDNMMDIKEEAIDLVASYEFAMDVTDLKSEEEEEVAECPVSNPLSDREEVNTSHGDYFQTECKQDLQDCLKTHLQDTPEVLSVSDSRNVNTERNDEVVEATTNDGSMDVTNRNSEKDEASGDIPEEQKRPADRKNPSKGRTFKCRHCKFETKVKSSLVQHKSVHKRLRKRTTFACDMCPYTGNNKYNFKLHQKVHDKGMIYCSICSYRTKKIVLFEHHLLIHGVSNASENDNARESQECASVDPNEDPNMLDIKEEALGVGPSNDVAMELTDLKSEEEEEVAKCPVSSPLADREEVNMGRDGSFPTECEQDLRDLVKTRLKDTPKVLRNSADVVSADFSDVNTERKDEVHEATTNDCSMDVTNRISEEEASGSVPHQPMRQTQRKDPSKGQTFKCRLCKFVTEEKGILLRHRRLHKYLRDHTMFTCDKCPYTTKNKSSFKFHQEVHDSGMMYCSTCSYRSRSKVLFEHHLLIHRESNASENGKAGERQECTSEDPNDGNIMDIKEEEVDLAASYDFAMDVTGLKSEEEEDIAECRVSNPLSDQEEVNTSRDDYFQTECKQDLRDLVKTHLKDTPEVLSVSADVVPADSGDVKTERKDEVLEATTNDCSMDVTNLKSEDEASGSVTDKPTRQACEKDPPKDIRIIKCCLCKFQGNVKDIFVHYKSVHKGVLLKNITFNCDKCPYTTKNQSVLKLHQEVHDKGMMSCSICSYRSRSKVLFEHHLLTHGESSTSGETQKSRDDQECSSIGSNDVNTVYIKEEILEDTTSDSSTDEADLKSEVTGALRHRDSNFQIQESSSDVSSESETDSATQPSIFKCAKCPFETGRKYYLKYHMVVHRDPSEVPTFKCNNCSYETKWKNCLVQHMIVHKKPWEVMMYRCKLCPYTTKWKNHIKRHVKSHIGNTIVSFCTKCPFKTKVKADFELHSLTHKESNTMDCSDVNVDVKQEVPGCRLPGTIDIKEAAFECTDSDDFLIDVVGQKLKPGEVAGSPVPSVFLESIRSRWLTIKRKL